MDGIQSQAKFSPTFNHPAPSKITNSLEIFDIKKAEENKNCSSRAFGPGSTSKLGQSQKNNFSKVVGLTLPGIKMNLSDCPTCMI